MRSLSLVPFTDPWPTAKQRWRDIDDQPYASQFRTDFKYTGSQVTLSYEPNPNKPYFVGHIEAHGLKPNFSYQLKLAGKPVNGSRGWGEKGDDRSNTAIGFATRWWNDTLEQNTTDEGFNENKALAPADQQTIYGYDYMGEFVTDASGNASVDFTGAFAYHIVWQDKQDNHQDKVYGEFNIGSTAAPYYAYSQAVPEKTVKLWYEWETGRSHDVTLPAGVYHARFLLTEETFHAFDPEDGGQWPTVLASEDFDSSGKPDSSTANDIVFTIK
jgi:hypothetical protein